MSACGNTTKKGLVEMSYEHYRHLARLLTADMAQHADGRVRLIAKAIYVATAANDAQQSTALADHLDWFVKEAKCSINPEKN